MNCRRVEPLLSNHLEGRLPHRAADEVTAHLADCPACRRLRDDLVAAVAELRDLGTPLPPPDLPHRAVERWMAERDGRRQTADRQAICRTDHLVRRAPLAGLVALLAALGLLIARWGGGGASRPLTPQIAQRSHSEMLITAPHLHRVMPPQPGLRTLSTNAPAVSGTPASGQTERAGTIPLAHSERTLCSHDCPSAEEFRMSASGTRHAEFFRTPAGRRGLSTNAPAVSGTPALPGVGRGVGRELNGPAPWWTSLPASEWDRIEERIRHTVPVRDDFVTIPFPRLASTSDRQIAQAVESYKRRRQWSILGSPGR